MVKNKLTSKQERFCQELMISNNGTQAYKKIYKCSDKAAESGASRTLSIAKVSLRMQQLRERVLKKTELTVKSVIDGILDTQRRAREEGNEKGIELKASDMLAKHVGAYEKNNEQQAIVIEQPLTEAQLKARLAAIGQAGTGLDNSSIGGQ